MREKGEFMQMIYFLLFLSAFYVLARVMGWLEEGQGSLIWLAALFVVPWLAWVLFDALFPEKDDE